jgi:hypothetical protein
LAWRKKANPTPSQKKTKKKTKERHRRNEERDMAEGNGQRLSFSLSYFSTLGRDFNGHGEIMGAEYKAKETQKSLFFSFVGHDMEEFHVHSNPSPHSTNHKHPFFAKDIYMFHVIGTKSLKLLDLS